MGIAKNNRGEESGPDTGSQVQSVERALLILETLAEFRHPVSLGELAERAGLKPSTAHRLLATLVRHDFVAQERDSRYKLGMRIYHIGTAATYALDIKEAARPFMQELLDRCNETVNLAILDQGEVVYIDQLESNNIVIVRMFARVGNRGPAYCTGSGKVLLAGLHEEELSLYLQNVSWQRFTVDTIIDPHQLALELERVRRNGFALDLGERDEGVRCVAAPIKNYDSQVVAALSVSGPSIRMTPSLINQDIVPLVQDLAGQISVRLGYNKKFI